MEDSTFQSLGFEGAPGILKRTADDGVVCLDFTRSELLRCLSKITGMQTNFLLRSQFVLRRDLVERSSAVAGSPLAYDEELRLTEKGAMLAACKQKMDVVVLRGVLQCCGDGNCERVCGGSGCCTADCRVEYDCDLKSRIAHRCRVSVVLERRLKQIPSVLSREDTVTMQFPLQCGHVRASVKWDRGLETQRGMLPWHAAEVRQEAGLLGTPLNIANKIALGANVPHGQKPELHEAPQPGQIARLLKTVSKEERGGGLSGLQAVQTLLLKLRDDPNTVVLPVAHEIIVVGGRLAFLLTLLSTEGRLSMVRTVVTKGGLQMDGMHNNNGEFNEVKQVDMMATSGKNRGSTVTVGLLNMERVPVSRAMLHCLQMAATCSPSCSHPLRLVRHHSPGQFEAWHHVRTCFRSQERFTTSVAVDMFGAQIMALREQGFNPAACGYHVNTAVSKHLAEVNELGPSSALDVCLLAVQMVQRVPEVGEIPTSVAMLPQVLIVLELNGASGRGGDWKNDIDDYLTDPAVGIFGQFYVKTTVDAHLGLLDPMPASTGNRKERDWLLQQRLTMLGKVPKLLSQRLMSIAGCDVNGKPLPRPSVFSVAALQDRKENSPYSQSERRILLSALALFLSGEFRDVKATHLPADVGYVSADSRAIWVSHSVVSWGDIVRLLDGGDASNDDDDDDHHRDGVGGVGDLFHPALHPILECRMSEVARVAGVDAPGFGLTEQVS